MKPYLIYTYPWDNSSAGNIVLHKLADALSKRFPGIVYTLAPDPRVDAKHISKCTVDRKYCIAVYPEVFGGNVFGCGTIVRYLLNVPGMFGGPKGFSREDIQFAFSNFFNRKIGLPSSRILTVPYLDLNQFYDKKMERVGPLYYRGKGQAPHCTPVPYLGTGLDYRGEHGQNALREILNQCTVLYSYDCISAMNEIARLCGCPVVLIPDDYWTLEDCKSLDTWNSGGIGFGLEEEEKAKSTINPEKLRETYDWFETIFQLQLDNFIRVTQGTI
jgi:hypothetical protein